MIAYHCRDGKTRSVLKGHLSHFHAQQMGHGRATAKDIVERAGLKCVIGTANRYYWRSKTVMLTPTCAHGTDVVSLGIAMHEVQHARQPRWLVALAAMLKPVEWWVELACWRAVFGIC